MASPFLKLSVAAGVLTVAGCASSSTSTAVPPAPSQAAVQGLPPGGAPPSPDPRVGLRAGLHNAQEAIWNLRVLSKTPAPPNFAGVTNSDLAFLGNYAIQGNYNGWQIWDISTPTRPVLRTAYVCPASQSDVSVYRNLLFISGEGLGGRLDCGTQPVRDTVSKDRLRGLRIFDISDIERPRNVGNVQTCRGSHTHTVLVDPKDSENVYVYISGSAPPRSPSELAGCSAATPNEDPNTALFRIEVIKVPVANPERAAIVTSPRIFANLAAPATHGEAVEDRRLRERAVEAAKARGDYTAVSFGLERPVSRNLTTRLLDSLVRARGGTGAPTVTDSATLRRELQGMIDRVFSGRPRTGPTQCHDITVFPAIGLAGGACEGYGFLLDIRDPANPVRIDQVADSNFSYWHSATFNNDGSKILFSDEWGGGGGPKCRASDPKEWGADALFTVENRRMRFQSYYKMLAPQTPQENCVAHNGSMIPIPGRDVMVQSWYQGGISVFDWTDPRNPREVAFFDRGPVDSTRMGDAGTWSAYWYNGVIVSSEIGRGLDILELAPSAWISQNEIDAARTVRFDYFNTQGQQQFVWPSSVALAQAYVDQLERSGGLPSNRITAVRQALAGANAQGVNRQTALRQLASQLEGEARGADAARIRLLAGTVRDLSAR